MTPDPFPSELVEAAAKALYENKHGDMENADRYRATRAAWRATASPQHDDRDPQ